MKEAMRDKVCQLIGKYQAEEASEGPRETAGGEVNSDTNGGR